MANSGTNELFRHNHTTLVEGAHNAFIVFRASLALELAKQFTILGIPVLVPAAAESNVASEDDPIEAKSPARSSTKDGDETLGSRRLRLGRINIRRQQRQLSVNHMFGQISGDPQSPGPRPRRYSSPQSIT